MLRMLVATMYLLAFFALTGIAAAQQRPVTAEGGSVAIGSDFPDNSALSDEIEMYMRLLGFLPRTRVPLDWAQTQNNLGIALARLGERDGAAGSGGRSLSRSADGTNPRARAPRLG